MSEKFNLIFGVPYPWSEEDKKEYLNVLKEFNVDVLDTGSTYPGSEKFIGDAGLSAQFVIHTKAKGWVPGVQSHDKILEYAAQSLKNLKADSVDTYYLHSPDPATPLSETLEAIQKLHLLGKFKHFGLSNFLPAQVQAVHDYMSAHNYVCPTVYEGNYNPIGGHAETSLFPLLRQLGMTFNAYSALAGGFLVKSPSEFAHGVGRWDTATPHGKMFHGLYNKPKLVEAMTTWDVLSKESGISKADLSYRWVAYHSRLSGGGAGSVTGKRDGIVLGARGPRQLRETLEGLRAGPLPLDVVERIEGVWEAVKEDAILDNYNGRNF